MIQAHSHPTYEHPVVKISKSGGEATGLNPGVSEALPGETLAEGVAAKHAGNEEAEGGKDRPDCIPEYCLFAWVGQQKC